jgi:hypothetical protein
MATLLFTRNSPQLTSDAPIVERVQHHHRKLPIDSGLDIVRLRLK